MTTNRYEYIEPPDLTDVGITDAFVTNILEGKSDIPEMLAWCPERRRWAYITNFGKTFRRWFAREEAEAIVRAFLDRLYRHAVAAAQTQLRYTQPRILKRAERLRSAAMLSTVIRLAKADQRLHRALASLKTYEGEPAAQVGEASAPHGRGARRVA